MAWRICLAAFLFLSGIVGSAMAAEAIRTTSGLLAGVREGDIIAYKGVPFAAPPVGDLRWRAPQPAKPWRGVRKADAFGPACMQPKVPGIYDQVSEDCLTLNIWRPADASGPLPIMVFLYGGGFWSGSASVSFTQGDNLARHGVMVVEPNYRVGPFGFLALAELSRESGKGSGAYGMMDAIAALKWVKANAAGFGGDPTRITLFGVSAGSLMVSAFTASPAARGLFTQVIGQSNGLFSPQPRSVAPLPLPKAEAAGTDYMKAVGAQSLAELRKLPADELLKPQMRWWAVIDGDVLTEEPYDTFAAGRQADVPTLTGGNATEGVFISPNPPVKAADWAAELKNNWGADAKALRKLYPFKTDAEAYWSRTMVAGEVNYTWQVWTWAHLQAKTGKAPVWMWRFEQPYPARDPKIAALMGTPHGAELYYIFQHYPQPDLFAWTDDDQKLGEVMAGYWTNFAKTGDPNGPGLPIWPRYALDKSQIIRLKTNPEVGPHPRKTELEFIDSVLAKTRAARSAPAPLVWWI